MLYYGNTTIRLLAVPLTIVLILMDSLDGMVARHRGEATLVGSALDIAADRAVEICLWVVHAHLGLIPLLIPLTFIIRGALTDSIRNVALQHGESAHSMMRSKWGNWIVASPAVRSTYAVIKATAFSLLALAAALRPIQHAWYPAVMLAAAITTWTSTGLCILRGLPVLVEAPKLFASKELVAAPPAHGEDD